MATKSPKVGAVGIAEEPYLAKARKQGEELRQKGMQDLAEIKKAEEAVAGVEGEITQAKFEQEKARLAGTEKAEAEYAGREKGLYEQSERQLEKYPFPTYKPTQEDATSYAQLGSMVVTLGMMLGGGAKMSGKAALASMTGMINGWREGRQDLWRREAQKFDKELQNIKAEREAIQKNLEKGLKLAATDRKAAQAAIDTAAHIAGQSVPGLLMKRGQLIPALNFMKSAAALSQKTEENILQNAATQQQHEEQRKDAEAQRQALFQIEQMRAKRTQARIDEKAMQAIGPALRNIAENYPDGTANTLLGASAEDKKRIQGSYRALEESETTADFVARNPEAVGALAVVRNIIKMDAIKSIGQSDNEQQAAQAKSALVDAGIDKAVQENKITADAAQQAKVLQKKLFGLALSDVQGSGQRGSVYLDRQFQNLYDQASRQDTLLKIIRERAEENNRNLRVYKMNIERHNNPENFPLSEAYDEQKLEKYIKDRKPKYVIGTISKSGKYKVGDIVDGYKLIDKDDTLESSWEKIKR